MLDKKRPQTISEGCPKPIPHFHQFLVRFWVRFGDHFPSLSTSKTRSSSQCVTGGPGGVQEGHLVPPERPRKFAEQFWEPFWAPKSVPKVTKKGADTIANSGVVFCTFLVSILNTILAKCWSKMVPQSGSEVLDSSLGRCSKYIEKLM